MPKLTPPATRWKSSFPSPLAAPGVGVGVGVVIGAAVGVWGPREGSVAEAAADPRQDGSGHGAGAVRPRRQRRLEGLGIRTKHHGDAIYKTEESRRKFNSATQSFLTLLQELGDAFGTANRVVLVDSSGGEVDRPSLADGRLEGLSDPEDPLWIDTTMPGGPREYIRWFRALAARQSTDALQASTGS